MLFRFENNFSLIRSIFASYTYCCRDDSVDGSGGGGGDIFAKFVADFTCLLIVVALQIGLVRFSDIYACVHVVLHQKANYIKWMKNIYAQHFCFLSRSPLELKFACAFGMCVYLTELHYISFECFTND